VAVSAGWIGLALTLAYYSRSLLECCRSHVNQRTQWSAPTMIGEPDATDALTAKALKGMSRSIKEAAQGREDLASATASLLAMRSELFGKCRSLMAVRTTPRIVWLPPANAS